MSKRLTMLILPVVMLLLWTNVSAEKFKDIDYARLGLAKSLNNLQQYDESRPILKDLHARYPDNKEIGIELVRALQYGKSYKKVVTILEDLQNHYPDDIDIKTTLADIYYDAGKIDEAEEMLRDIVTRNPSDTESTLKLAEILAANQDYEQAMQLCRRVLSAEPDNKFAALWLARILSWNKHYEEAIVIYDEIISRNPNSITARREKARVLGWDKKYDQSIAVYKQALETTDASLSLRYEMNAKYNLYNRLDIAAIDEYRKWLALEPFNPEAMFDLAQLYSAHMQWSNAEAMYERILKKHDRHFRAEHAFKKIELYSKKPQLSVGFEMLKADSDGRQTNKRSWNTFTSITQPLNDKYLLTLRQDNIWYRFEDIAQAYRQRYLIGLSYHDKPRFWAGAHYTYSQYPQEKGVKNTFGGEINYAPRDRWLIHLSHLREEITDNQITFTNKRYRDNYKIRSLYRHNRRLLVGVDYMYSHYSDENERNALGLDVGYEFSYEPHSLKLIYRYEEYKFNRTTDEYFSPDSFHYNSVDLRWRHFLNKGERFWGSNNTFYSIGYAVNFDVKKEIGHKLYFDFHHDWNDKCSSHIEWSKMIYENSGTYRQDHLMFYTRFYF